MVTKKKVAKKKVVRKKATKKKAVKKKVTVKKNPPGARKFTKAQMELLEKFVQMNDEELKAHLPDPDFIHNPQHPLSDSEVEARLVMLYRLQLRGLTTKDIAHQLNLSVDYVYKLRAQLKERHISGMNATKWVGYIAETIAFYDEMKHSAVMLSGSKSASASAKAQALQTAMKAEADKQSFLARLGVLGSDAAKNAAAGYYLPVEEEKADHDKNALDAVQLIAERMRTVQHEAIDVVAEQVFDE